jgi:hypothetical protein
MVAPLVVGGGLDPLFATLYEPPYLFGKNGRNGWILTKR